MDCGREVRSVIELMAIISRFCTRRYNKEREHNAEPIVRAQDFVMRSAL